MWNGLLRRDGVSVSTLDTANKWVICSPGGQITLDVCPCCSLPMRTEQAAKLVADKYVPILPDAA